jgi:pimeloyl-ACP methyl ester carboxylesterase
MKLTTRHIVYALLAVLILPLFSCGQKDEGFTEEMLWLRHQGAEMPIWVRGNPDSDVIVLTVHGGAGGNSGVYISSFADTLERDYQVAYWDQRHAGSSYGAFGKDEFSTDNALALMALDMKLAIDLLHLHYGKDKKIFAFGHSWGVQLGTKYLIDHGDKNQLTGWIANNGPHSATEEYSARGKFIERWATEMDEKGLPLSVSMEYLDIDVSLNSPREMAQWARDNDPVLTWDQALISWDVGAKIQRDYVYPTYVEPTLDPGNAGPSSINLYLTSGPYSTSASLFNGIRTGSLINNALKEQSIQEFYDLTPHMGSITLPTALLWGRFDQISGPESAEAYRDAISTPPEHITLKLYDAAHSPSHEQTTAFSEDITAFIEAHRAR